MRYLVRKNCEYSIVVAADDEDSACEKANEVLDIDWDQSWSDFEADEYD